MSLLIAGLKRDWLPIAIMVTFAIITNLVRTAYELPPVSYTSFLTNSVLVTSGVLISGMFWFIGKLAIDRPDRPLVYLNTSVEVQSKVRNLVQSMLLIFLVCVFLPSFGLLKSMVGLLRPYEWDALFIQWDIAIHGQDAWLLIQPIFGYPAVTFLIAIAYQLWILLLYIGFPLVCMWQKNTLLRQQMIISFLLCWIVIGVIMANWFSSVGPCFLEPIMGDTRFQDQMSYLAGVDKLYPMLVLDVQKQLLESHLAGNHGLGRGISAMPSMHVSIAFLFMLFAWNISRLIGILATAFLFVILIGSVHLAYHYAVDGYVSIIVTALIWWGSGMVARRLPQFSHRTELAYANHA